MNILVPDQRSHGMSEGKFITFGVKESKDMEDWLAYYHRELGKWPILLYGISMGASTMLYLSDRRLSGDVRGIIADCGFTSPNDIWKHVVEKNLHLPYDLSVLLIEGNCRKKLNMGPRAYSAVDAMKVCEVPVLFIHGTSDSFVPIEMTYRNYLACKAPKRLFVVPGAEHAMSYFLDKEGYENSILSFWKDFDKINEVSM